MARAYLKLAAIVALGLAVFRPVELKADQPVERAPILGP